MLSARSLGLTVVGSSGGQDLVLCPLHNDKRPSAWYSQSKGLFYCSVCGIGFNQFQLAKALKLDIDFGEEMEEEEREPPHFDLIPESMPKEMGKDLYHIYFETRGVSCTAMYKYQVKWQSSPLEAVIFPVYSGIRGEFKGAVLRFLDAKRAGTRYLKMGFIPPYWPLERYRPVGIFTEGGFSALRMSTYMRDDEFCYSLFGAKANKQLVDMTKVFDKAVFLYDDDIAGERACRKMREMNPTAFSYTLSTAPDDMEESEIVELWGKIRRVIDA